MDDKDFMKLAIKEAEKCQPSDPARIPCVGAVIGCDGELLAAGHRGTHDHAEKRALDNVKDLSNLRRATIYTTLEPCTGAVRSRPLEACTNLLLASKIKKVFIGILDPNQGVCGKGLLELQKHNIEVALFEHDLAQKIRDLNAAFIREQQTLGVEIFDPKPSEKLSTYKTGGKYTFQCTCITPPGADIYVLVERYGFWWPQPGKLRQVGDTNKYKFEVHFGATGEHSIHIVKASELGSSLIAYYNGVSLDSIDRRKRLKEKLNTDGMNLLDLLGSDYKGIAMPSLPRGLDSQGHVTVTILDTPYDCDG
jgi:pyrimidine deaminase RibD-like protein